MTVCVTRQEQLSHTSNDMGGKKTNVHVRSQAGRPTLVLVSLCIEVDPDHKASKWSFSLRGETRMAQNLQKLFNLTGNKELHI